MKFPKWFKVILFLNCFLILLNIPFSIHLFNLLTAAPDLGGVVYVYLSFYTLLFTFLVNIASVASVLLLAFGKNKEARKEVFLLAFKLFAILLLTACLSIAFFYCYGTYGTFSK